MAVPERHDRHYLDALTDFVCGTRLDDIPGAVLEQLSLVFADTLAVIAAGMRPVGADRILTHPAD